MCWEENRETFLGNCEYGVEDGMFPFLCGEGVIYPN